MPLVLVLTSFALFVLAAYAPSAPASAAFAPARPDSSEWQNLLVLPDSLTQDETVGIMREFNDALGVQCGYCHVREDGDVMPALDEKAPKEIARGMIRMTWQITTEIFPAIEALGESNAPQVTCYTCHRGTTHVPTGADDDEPDGGHGDHPHGPR